MSLDPDPLTENNLNNEIQHAYSLLESKDFVGAHKRLNNILRFFPRDLAAQYLMLQIDWLKGRPFMAIAQLKRLIRDVPTWEEGKNTLKKFEQQVVDAEQYNYLNTYLGLRNTYMDYPFNIQIETTGMCQADCSFCVHESLDRKSTNMSDDVFEKIIADAKKIPKYQALNYYLNMINEPFLDKKIFDRIAVINACTPHATIWLYSNFNALPKKFFENIWEVKNLRSMNISFNSANKHEYERTMKIDFDKTVLNISKFMHENKKRGFLKGPVILSRIGDVKENNDRFVSDCQNIFKDFKINDDYIPSVKRRSQWIGDRSVQETTPVPLLQPCLQWMNITITCTGEVPHCCMDASCNYPIGNLQDQGLLEIYNSDQFRNYRERLIHREMVFPCNQCSLL